MNYFNLLPTELLHVIAQDSEPAYKALLVYPRFARAVSYDKRLDYMVGFGHNVRVHNSSIEWTRHKLLHRRGNPAAINYNGDVLWYRNGLAHRDDGPAIIHRDGEQRWYRDGKLHRNDGPALILANGDERWYRNGVLCD